MLYGAPTATFYVLQRAQNNLARVVCQRGQTDARPLLRSLHWLPVKHRVTYRMVSLMFKTISSSTPVYWATWSRRLFQFVLCSHLTLRCWLSQEREASSLDGHFRSWPHAPGTHYHPTLDPAVLWTLQTTPQDPPVQTVLTWCHQRLCIFRIYGTIQMLFYYFNTHFSGKSVSANSWLILFLLLYPWW